MTKFKKRIDMQKKRHTKNSIKYLKKQNLKVFYIRGKREPILEIIARARVPRAVERVRYLI